MPAPRPALGDDKVQRLPVAPKQPHEPPLPPVVPLAAAAMALAAPAAVAIAAINTLHLMQDPTFRVLLGAGGAFAGALASDQCISESGSPAIMPMGAVLGAAVGLLGPKMVSNPFVALGMAMTAALVRDFAERTMTGTPEDVRELSKIAALGCAVLLGFIWPSLGG